MRSPNEIAADYLAAWNTGDGAERARLLRGWTESSRYEDPLVRAEGRDGIAALIAGVRAQFPGHGFTLKGAADGHGCFVRFSWTLAAADGAPVAGGSDVVRLDQEGRVAEVIGFLDGSAA